MMLAQFVELDIFLQALQRGVTGELLEAGDMDPLRDAARDRPPPEAVPGKGGTVEPGPFLTTGCGFCFWVLGEIFRRPCGHMKFPAHAHYRWKSDVWLTLAEVP